MMKKLSLFNFMRLKHPCAASRHRNRSYEPKLIITEMPVLPVHADREESMRTVRFKIVRQHGPDISSSGRPIA